MIYNLIIYFYLLGVAIYSRFYVTVRKRWRGEREAFRVLKERWILRRSMCGSMLLRWESLSRGAH